MFLKVLFILFLLSKFGFAADYYISPTGNDINDGSIGYPFLTIQHACNIVNPGDTIILREGTYINSVTSGELNYTECNTVDGTENNPITIKNYAGETPIITASKVIAGGWSNYSGNVWYTNNSIGLGSGIVYGLWQVSADGTTSIYTATSGRNCQTTNIPISENNYCTTASTSPADKVFIYSAIDPNILESEGYVFRVVSTGRALTIEKDWYVIDGLVAKWNSSGIIFRYGADHGIMRNTKSFYCTNWCIAVATSDISPDYYANDFYLHDIETGYANSGFPNLTSPAQYGFKGAADNNTISGSGLRLVRFKTHDNNYHGIQISEGWSNVEVDNCLSYNNNIMLFNDGADFRLGTSNHSDNWILRNSTANNSKYNLYLNGDINNVHIYNNVFRNAKIASIGIDTVTGTESCSLGTCYIYNNLLLDSDSNHIILDDSHNWEIYNNTLINSISSSIKVIDNSFYSVSAILKNNIIIAPTGANLIEVASGESITSNYNAFYSPDATPFSYAGTSYNFSDYKTASGQDANSISSNFTGEFIDYASGNYRLTPSSTTLKDAGTSLSLVPYDKLGQIRPQGSGYSIGAYEEYIEGTTVGGLTITGATIN